jgi:DNA topoisomerase-2
MSSFWTEASDDTSSDSDPAPIREYLFVFLNVTINNPTFDSETKETRTLKSSDFGSTCDLPDNWLKRLMKTDIPD